MGHACVSMFVEFRRQLLGGSFFASFHGFQGFNSAHIACTAKAFTHWAILPASNITFCGLGCIPSYPLTLLSFPLSVYIPVCNYKFVCESFWLTSASPAACTLSRAKKQAWFSSVSSAPRPPQGKSVTDQVCTELLIRCYCFRSWGWGCMSIIKKRKERGEKGGNRG